MMCRVNRRNFKLANGEDSDARSANDHDSDNDAKLKNKRQRTAAGREGGTSGGLLDMFGGGGSWF